MKQRLVGLSVLLIISLSLTLIVWNDLQPSLLNQVPILDEAYYLDAPGAPYYMSSLYPLVVKASFSPFGLRLLQNTLWLLIAVLLFKTAKKMGLGNWSFIPSVLWLFYRPGLIMANSVLLEIPLLFCTMLVLFLTMNRYGSIWRYIFAGLFLGFAAMLRTHTILLLLPILFIIKINRRTIFLPLVALLLLSIPAVINSVKCDTLCGPSLNGGVNLYIGNSQQANGFFQTHDGFNFQTDPTGMNFLSIISNKEIDNAAKADREWFVRAISETTFLRSLKLWVQKVRLHFVGNEIPQIAPFSVWSEEVTLMKTLVLPYWFISGLGLSGFLMFFKKRKARLLILSLLILLFSQSLFFVVSRYRVLLVPIMLLLSTLFIRQLFAGKIRTLKVAATIIIATIAVLPWGLHNEFATLEKAGLENMANRSLKMDAKIEKEISSGNYEKAIPMMKRQIERNSTPVMLHNLIVAFAKKGKYTEATYYSDLFMDQFADNPQAWIDSSMLLIKTEKREKARVLLEKAVEKFPSNRVLQHNLSKL